MASQPTYPALRTLPKMIAFLEEKLSDAEMEQVEQMIEEDELYAFALERLHQAMLKGENVEAIASQFQEVFVKTIREEVKPEAKRISFPVWRIVTAAAVVIFLALIFIPQDEGLIDPAITPYEPRITIRSGEQYAGIKEFLTVYNQQDFQNAIQIGENILTDTIPLSANMTEEIHLSLGCSYLYLENYEQAATWLEKGLESGEIRIQTEARWYLALAYLKQGQNLLAEKYLKEILSSEAGKTRKQAAEKMLDLIVD